jgi:hypothetical protein
MLQSETHKIEVFLCYAHEDEELRQKLETHLGALQRQGIIDLWYDRHILPGSQWKRDIDTRLNTAQIILLLISPDFVASDYCYGIEMKRALQRHAEGSARVIPILLRPVDWQDTPFRDLQVLPANAHPVTGRHWHNPDEALADVVHGIRQVVEQMRGKLPDELSLPPSSNVLSQAEPRLSSHVVLIDASLDPHDSPYEQTREQGKKIIRYKYRSASDGERS